MKYRHAALHLRSYWVDVGLLIATFLLLLFFSHPLIHGDGLAHLMYLDSIARDGDLDLSNQALRFGHVNTYQLFAHPHSGELVTAFPYGSAYLLAPWYWLGATLDRLVPALQVNAAYFQEHQGVSLAYSLSASFGAMFYMLLAVWLSYDAARRVTTSLRAAVAAGTGLLGTTSLFYATMEPLSTHTYGACLVSLALWLAARAHTRHRTMGWTTALAMGLVLGLATLVRWQLALYALAAGAVLVWSAYRKWCSWRAVGAFTVGTGSFVVLCMWYFWRYFGWPFLIPTESQSGQQFFGTAVKFLPQVLLDTQHGWLVWSPFAILGIVGLLTCIFRGTPGQRSIALAALCAVLLEVLLNGSLKDWYGGWAFGQRRMTEAYSLLVFGAAWLLHGDLRWNKLWYGLTIGAGGLGLVLFVGHLYLTHTNPTYAAGGPAIYAIQWLMTQPHGPPLLDVLRDRYGPWAWSYPLP